VLAEGRVASAAYSDAVRLEGVGIDTGRYHLAPGVRAFGVTTANSAHCYQCAYSESALRLFVREGRRLRQVLEGLAPAETTSDDDAAAPGCIGATVETTRTIAVAPTRHAGYADLVVTTQVVSQPGFADESTESAESTAPAASVDCGRTTTAAPVAEAWIYDGRRYRAAGAPR